MIWRTVLHYARFGLVLALVSCQLAEEQKKQILYMHNLFRSQVEPQAADMLLMTWDNGLALAAETYAARCIWGHNDDVINELGENLYITTGTLNINKSMSRWFEEEKHYNYLSNTCLGGMCGHYTQVVWAKSDTVGCASHFCETLENTDYTDAVILVCNYLPPGNVLGHHPYEAGLPCSKCPEKAIECIKNMCASSESPTEESELDTWPTDEPWTEPVSSVGSTKPSGASFLLAGLAVASIL